MTGGPRVLRIVVTYEDGALSSQAFQAVQRTRRSLRRAGYLARVDLLPRSGAEAGAADAILAAGPSIGADLDTLVVRLAESGTLVRGPEPPRTIATHRGFQAIGERARIAE